MILGIGVDILEISRIHAVLRRRGAQRFAQRILSKRELEEFTRLDHSTWSADSQKDKKAPSSDPALVDSHAKYLSSRWALKEAAYKALPPDVQRRTTMRALDLRHAPTGAPALAFDPAVAGSQVAGISLMASISHDGGFVVGSVLALRG